MNNNNNIIIIETHYKVNNNGMMNVSVEYKSNMIFPLDLHQHYDNVQVYGCYNSVMMMMMMMMCINMIRGQLHHHN